MCLMATNSGESHGKHGTSTLAPLDTNISTRLASPIAIACDSSGPNMFDREFGSRPRSNRNRMSSCVAWSPTSSRTRGDNCGMFRRTSMTTYGSKAAAIAPDTHIRSPLPHNMSDRMAAANAFLFAMDVSRFLTHRITYWRTWYIFQNKMWDMDLDSFADTVCDDSPLISPPQTATRDRDVVWERLPGRAKEFVGEF